MFKKLSLFIIVFSLIISALISSISDERIVLCSLGSNIIFLNQNSCTLYIEHIGVSDDYINKVNDKHGITTILNANTHNKFRVAKSLINQGVNINSINKHDDQHLPPLHSAALMDDIEAFTFLIKNGANIEAKHPTSNENLEEFIHRLIKQNPTTHRINMLKMLDENA